MGGIRSRIGPILAVAVLFVPIACASQRDRLDLAKNERLYVAPGYRAAAPVDRSAFLAPVVDDRESVGVEEASGPYPTRWIADGVWERTLPLMVGDCLRAAFEESGVFAGLEQSPAAAALIVEPHLLAARGGQEERVFGRRSLGTFGIRIVIRGAPGADGTRAVLLDEQFDQTVGTEVDPNPERVPVVMGRALQQAVARVLAKIDQSNVARSGL